jgi:Flp pilus assembly pilin Flp
MKLKSNKSQALVEYCLLLSLISLATVATLRGIGEGVKARLLDVYTNLQ